MQSWEKKNQCFVTVVGKLAGNSSVVLIWDSEGGRDMKYVLPHGRHTGGLSGDQSWTQEERTS